MKAPRGAGVIRAMTRTIKITVLAVLFSLFALPVYGYFQWLQDRPGMESAGNPYENQFENPFEPPAPVSLAVKYPYPDKEFVMTGNLWRKSLKSVQSGNPDWYDVEIVRQRAEMEDYVPAMDLLAWMYEKGRGLKMDLRKAFTWYERAKMAGRSKLSGDPVRIFKRLRLAEKFQAQLQLAEDIERLKPEAKVNLEAFELEGYKRIKLHVLEPQYGARFSRKTRNRTRAR